MVSKITLLHTADNLWTGVGVGKFGLNYPKWQAEYFSDRSNTNNDEYFRSSEIYLAMNEYLQLLVEVGVFRFVCIVLFIGWVLKRGDSRNESINMCFKTILIAILCQAAFSYPFHSTTISSLFLFCVGVLLMKKRDQLILKMDTLNTSMGLIFNKFIAFATIAIGLLVLLFVLNILRLGNAYYSWVNAREDFSSSENEKFESFLVAYEELNNDGKFLTEFGEFLSKDSVNSFQAPEILDKACTLHLSARGITALGNVYWKLKDYKSALKNFRWLGDFLPNRFKPQYAILNLYREMGDTLNAIKTAKRIVDMPIKVSSIDVNIINRESSRYLIEMNPINK